MTESKDLESVFEYQASTLAGSPETSYFKDIESEYFHDIEDPFADAEAEETKSDGKSEKKTTARLWMFLTKKDIFLCIVAVFFIALSAIVPVAVSVLLAELFDKVSRYLNYSSTGAFVKDITWNCFGIALVGVGATLTSWISLAAFLVLGERQQTRCRHMLYTSILHKEMEWFDSSEQVEAMLTQLNRCVEEYRSGISEGLAYFLRTSFTIISLLVVSFYYAWRLALLVLATVPIIIVLSTAFGVFIQRYTNLENDTSANAIDVMEWNLLSYLWVRVNNSKKLELQKFGDQVTRSKAAYIKLRLFSNLNLGISKTLALMMFVQSFWYGSYLVRHKINTSGSVLSCFYSAMNLAMQFNTFSNQIVMLQKASISLTTIFKLFSENKSPSDEDKKGSQFTPKHHIKGNVELKDVSFKYPSRNALSLKNVSLYIPAASLAFIVGRSGSGKSTISSLLLGLYETNAGKITIDGYDVARLDKGWLASQITLVQQRCVLFEGTVKENICMSLSNTCDDLSTISMDLINSAVQNSLCDEFVKKLPNGLDTQIGSSVDSVSLSGGQRQRIALARAFIKNTPILILDESISAIDPTQKDILIRRIKRLRKGKTTFILTHNFDEIDEKDMVYLMENGEIAESGLKGELLKREEGMFSLLESYGRDNQKRNSLETIVPEKTLEEEELVHSDNPFAVEVEKAEAEEGQESSSNKNGIIALVRTFTLLLTLSSKMMFLLGILVSVINTALTPVFTYCLSKLVVGIVKIDSKSVSSDYLMKWGTILSMIAILDGLTLFLSKMFLSVASEALTEKLRTSAFDKILKQQLEWFQSCHPSELSSLLLNDTRDLRAVVAEFTTMIVSILVLITVCSIWSTIVFWKLALVGLSFVPLFAIVALLFSFASQKCESQYKDDVIRLENLIHESLVGIKTVACLDLRKYFTSKFDVRLKLVLSSGTKRAVIMGLGMSLQNVVLYLCQAILLYYGLKLVAYKESTISAMMQVISLIVFSISSITSLLTNAPDFNRGLRTGAKISEILQFGENDNELGGCLKPDFRSPHNSTLFDFEKVTFSYPNAPSIPVLADLNLKIRKHEITCIVGKSGSGKSSLAMLLLRLYPLKTGTLQLLQRDISTVDTHYLRSSIAVVTQDHYFFDGTIRENLTYNSTSSITDQKILEVLDLLNMKQFVLSLPMKLDTRMGGSSNLLISGGQSQRLSLARALLRKPEVLILDECTSSLDPENTVNVSHLLSTLKHQISIICITHERELMRVADHIVQLQEGSIFEEGSYTDLVAQKTGFYEFIMAQKSN